MTQASVAPVAARPSARSGSSLILAIALIECLSGITQGYLSPIVPGLGGQFHISDATVNGIFVISNVAFAVLAPVIPRLGDSYGHRLVLRISIVLTAVGALLMAVVSNLTTVVIGVVLITCVVGFVPLMLGIMRVAAPERTRSGAGMIIGVLMITIGVGGLLAGYVGERTPSRGFWIAVPFAVLALVCSFFLPDTDAPTRERIAVRPFLACTAGLIGFVTALSMAPVWGWTDARTLGCGIAGVALLAVWIVLDARGANQFVDLRIFRIHHLRVNSLATFFFGFASISFLGTNGIFLASDAKTAGYGFGYDAMQIAWVVAAIMAASVIASFLAGRLLNVIGGRSTLVLAGVLLALGFISLAVMHESLGAYAVGAALFGLGIGAYQAAVRPLSIEGVPEHETATSAGVNELSLSIGAAIGTAAIELLQTSNAHAGELTVHGLDLILGMLAAASVIAAVIALFYKVVPTSRATSEAKA